MPRVFSPAALLQQVCQSPRRITFACADETAASCLYAAFIAAARQAGAAVFAERMGLGTLSYAGARSLVYAAPAHNHLPARVVLSPIRPALLLPAAALGCCWLASSAAARAASSRSACAASRVGRAAMMALPSGHTIAPPATCAPGVCRLWCSPGW